MEAEKSSNSKRPLKAVLKLNNRNFGVYDGHNTLGRSRTATIIIKNISVSQQHAIITVVDDRHFVSEITASNGTYLDDVKLVPMQLYELSEDSIIKLADVHGTYHKTTDETELDQIVTEQTQSYTESFYNAETQSNGDFTFNNIHDLPTQAAIFSPPKEKKRVQFSIAPPVTIHDLPTQTFCADIAQEVQINSDEPEENVELVEEVVEEVVVAIEEKKSSNESLDLLDAAASGADENEQLSEPSSQLHVDRLRSRVVRRVLSSSDTNDEESSTKTPQDSGLGTSELDASRRNQKVIINSDSETDIEDDVLEQTPLRRSPRKRIYTPQVVLATDSEDERGNSLNDTDVLVETTLDASSANKEESVVIPATQDAFSEHFHFGFQTQNFVKELEPQNVTQKSNESGSESFKLHLTELTEASENTLDVNATIKTVETDAKSTSPVTNDRDKSLNLLDDEVRRMNEAGPSRIADEPDDIYLQPTQKFIVNPHDVVQDMYEAATQKIDTLEINDDDENDNHDDEDIYLQPTQKLVIGKRTSPARSETETADDDIYLQPTQKLVFGKPRSEANRALLDEFVATEKGDKSEDETIFSAPTQLFNPRELTKTEDDVYLQPTQKFRVPEPEPKKADVESQLEVLFPTQTVKLGEVVDTRPRNPLVNIFQVRNQTSDESETEDRDERVVVNFKRTRSSVVDEFIFRDNETVTRDVAESVKESEVRTALAATDSDTSDKMEVFEKESLEKSKGRPVNKRSLRSLASRRSGRSRNDLGVFSSSKTLDGATHETVVEETTPTPEKSDKTARVAEKSTETPQQPEPILIDLTKQTRSGARKRKEKASVTSTSSNATNESEATRILREPARSKRKKSDLNTPASATNARKAVEVVSVSSSSSTEIRELYVKPRTRQRATRDTDAEVESDADVLVASTPQRRLNVEERLRLGESPPKRRRTERQSLSMSDVTLMETPGRLKRKQKPLVAFTMMEKPELKSLIRNLGGRVVDTANVCTVLVSEHVRRSQKLLMAVGQGKPICAPAWLLECKRANAFLDPWDYVLQDEEAETKWNFSLKESLNRSRAKKLLQGYTFVLFVSTALDVLKGAIEACGGKFVMKAPPRIPQKFVVVANPENKAKYSRFLKQVPPALVIAPEAIFDGVLRQELHFDDHLLT